MVPALRKTVVEELGGDEDFSIDVSQVDRDPYQIVTAGQEKW